MMDKREQRGPHIAIIGAGVAGISTAIALKRQLGFENFTIYEKASEVGGTWRDNVYPGCACDIRGHWYSLSTDQNPYWTDQFPVQAELLQYWLGLVEKHNLRKHIKFNSKLTLAKWDNDRQLYEMEFEEWGPEALARKESGVTAARWTEEAEALVNAIGGFIKLGYPRRIFGDDYEKQEVFKGQVFHSGKWRYDIPLKGKRVGVIGNGCSVAQFLPKISEDPSVEVINFCRTPSWFAPRVNERYSSRAKWLFAWVPGFQRTYRNFLSIRSDVRVIGMYKNNEKIQEATRKALTQYIRDNAPAKYLDKLIPSYPVGCKRIIIDPGYLKALHRPNISINFDGVESLTEEGIKTATGEVIPLDVIILGTGFAFGDLGMDIVGSEGRTLSEYFESKGGRTAYMGTCVPEFPNHFMLLGPNTATGHASVIFAEECQINYTINLLKPIIASYQGQASTSKKGSSSSIKSYAVTHAATDAYNADIQSRHSKMVWTECMSYYRENQDGKNTAIFPGPMVLFWWWTRKVRWSDFICVKGDGSKSVGRGMSWLRLLGVKGWMRLSVWTVLTALLGAYVRGGLSREVIRTAIEGGRGAFGFQQVNETLRVVADRLVKW